MVCLIVVVNCVVVSCLAQSVGFKYKSVQLKHFTTINFQFERPNEELGFRKQKFYLYIYIYRYI